MENLKLENYTYTQLKDLATNMDLKIHRSKKVLIEEITIAFKEYKDYKTEKIDKYIKGNQLGEKGQQGTTYSVLTADGIEYAMKTFRKHKSSTNLQKEFDLQKLAANCGACGNVIDLDTVSKYIIMEKMDFHLVNVLKEQGTLTKLQQKQIIHIYKKLDDAKVFHGDANLLNYMYKGSKLRIIDFGSASAITPSLIRKLGTDTPNITIMTLGLILKLKDMKYPKTSYEYLIKYLTDEQRLQFGLVLKKNLIKSKDKI